MVARAVLVVGLLVLVTQTASAQVPDALSWYSVDAGGVQSARDGRYTASATIGQPEAGYASAGRYEMASGFWGRARRLSQSEWLSSGRGLQLERRVTFGDLFRGLAWLSLGAVLIVRISYRSIAWNRSSNKYSKS